MGIKGSPFWDNTEHRDIIRESRREHGRKPEAFYTTVEKITAGRRLEYFIDQPTKDGRSSEMTRPSFEVALKKGDVGEAIVKAHLEKKAGWFISQLQERTVLTSSASSKRKQLLPLMSKPSRASINIRRPA